MSPAIQRRKFSVPQVAMMLGVADAKIIAWIKAGELRAVNLARSRNGRPRYAIDVADIEAFERSREVVPADGVTITRRLRRRATENVKQFF
jgi:hypothetical protein